ncbi:sugar ABC transporter permease [Deinococcus psychrotolerans]|uniref:Sugar ABC transporter permease n=1 Tax=Deinococcus psychrotolerans TaxID=2489213 RepID=A0A3G8YGA4_9DEIO|nr:sugar ABC transporter permease [Deinococcus psychrotolerans]AZI44322.1 sugar ABC transporter permease [Deinococcus psychrotolerans]
MRYQTRLRLWGYAFLLPSVLLFAAVVAYPLLNLFRLSTFESGLFTGTRFVGIDNYVKMLEQPQFYQSLKVTLIWTLGVVPLTLVLGLLVALLLNQGAARFTGFFRVVYFIPVVTNMVAASFVWKWLFEPTNGVVNYFAASLHLAQPGWLADPKYALSAMMVVGIWKQLGFAMVLFLAGLQGLPREVLDAARIDGASSSQAFWFVKLPLLNATLIFVLVLLTVNAFRVFTIPYVMSAGGLTYGTPGGPLDSTRVFAIHIYDLGFKAHQMGAASAAAVALLLLTMLLTLLQFRLVGRPGSAE